MPAKNVLKRTSVNQIKGMDVTSSICGLPEGKARLIRNLRPFENRLYTREGITRINAAEISAGKPVYGVGHHVVDGSTEYNIAVCNGGIYKVTDAGVVTGPTGPTLSTTKQCQITQFGNVSLIVDQTTGIVIWKDGKTPYLAGLPSPKVYKLIDSFEVVWTVTSGGAVVLDDTIKVHGSYSLKVTNTAAANCIIYKTFTSMKLNGTSVFSDSSDSNTDDYIAITVIRQNPADITACWLKLGDTGLTNYWKARLDLTPEWLDSQINFTTLDIKIRKKSFEVGGGTPNWEAITQAQLEIQADTGDAAVTRWDFLRLEKSGPRGFEYNKEIANVDPTETWVTAGSTLAWNWQYFIKGNNSLAITANSSGEHVYRLGTWDLTTFIDGGASSIIDEIEIYLGKSTAGYTPSVELRFYHDFAGAVYAYTTLVPTSVNSLSRFAVSKALFTAGGGFASGDWASIERITLVLTSNASSTVFVDAISLVKHRNVKVVALCEPVEVGTWAMVTTSGLSYTWNSNPIYVNGDEGSTYSLNPYLQRNETNGGTFIFSFTPTAALNLSIFATSVTVQTGDKIGLFMACYDYRSFKSITLKYGPVGMATHYYYHTFNKEDLPDLCSPGLPTGVYGGSYHPITGLGGIHTAYWFNLRAKISEHTAVGTPNWNSIAEMRLEIVLEPTVNTTDNLFFDAWTLIRKGDLNGIYNYKVTFISIDGEESDGSNISDDVILRNNPAYISNIPTTAVASSNIVGRNIYRLGGSSGEWRLLTRLDNLTTVAFIDETIEDNLGSIIEEEIEGQPFIPKAICIHKDKIVIANLTGPDGIIYPSGVMVSEAGSYDVFNTEKMFEIEGHSGRQIRWLHSAFDKVYVAKEDSIWSFDPDDLTKPPHLETRLYGGYSAVTVVQGENEFYFLDPSGRIISFNSSFFSDVSADIYADLKTCVGFTTAVIHLQYYDDLLMFFFVDSAAPTTCMTYACYKPYAPNKFWFDIYPWKVCSSVSFKTVTGNRLYIGSATLGLIYRAFYGTTDDTAIISTYFHTKMSDFDQPETRKDYLKLFIFVSFPTGTLGSFSITPLYDDGSGSDTVTVAASTSNYSRLEIPLPPMTAGYPVNFLGFKIVTSTTFGYDLISFVEIVRLFADNY